MGFQDLYVRLVEDIDYDPIVIWIVEHIQSNPKILDAGCGSGVILVPLIERGYDVTGIDIDDRMLSYAHQSLVNKGLPTPLFTHDLRQPIGQKFDVILLFNDVVNYFKGIQGVFRHLKSALNPNGFVLFDCYRLDYLEVMQDYIETETEPVPYTWTVKTNQTKLTHTIQDAHDTYKIQQYVYPITYYVDMLRKLGFQVTELSGPDERKHYIKASL